MNNLKNVILLLSLARIAWIDGKKQWISNKGLGRLLLARFIFLSVEAMGQPGSRKLLVTEALFGCLIGGGVFFLCYCMEKKAMGAGDVKLMAVLGSYLGGEKVLWTAFFAAIYGLFYMRWKGKKKISFAPFVFAGYLTVLLLKT